jgi:hypothetical protein
MDESWGLDPHTEENETLQEERPIGVVQGPGEDNNRYLFVTSDNHTTKVGEFVHYYPHNDNNAFPVYGKIVSRSLKRPYPASFLQSPSVSPRALAALMGNDPETHEQYEIDVQILGSWNQTMHCFVNPRLTPDPGDTVFLTSDLELAAVLSPCGAGQLGSAHLGHLLTRGGERVPIVLNVSEMVSTHVSILAGTGSGKSYTAAVLIEELLKPYNRAAVLIADPHGEYATLQEMVGHHAFQHGTYEPKVSIKPPHQIRIRLSSLRQSDLRYLLPGLTEKQSHFLAEAYRKVVGRESDEGSKQWGLSDLKQALYSLAPDGGENASTVNALMWKIDMRFGRSKELFSDSEHIPLTDLFAPGQCTVLQLSEIDTEDQQIILSTLLRRAFYSRVNAVKGNPQSPQEALDFPVFILMEEAHRFAPAGGRAITTNILKTLLAEGRKFGLGIGVISQRPGKLDSDILSQCMTQLFMRIVNPVDQKSIAESVESAGRDLLSELPSLTRGQVIVAGNAVHTPVLTQVRTRITKHGGETLDAPQEWMKHFSKANQARQKRQKAAVADSQKPKRRGGRIV